MKTTTKYSKPLAGICRIPLNRYWQSYVNIEQYEALVRGEGRIKRRFSSSLTGSS